MVPRTIRRQLARLRRRERLLGLLWSGTRGLTVVVVVLAVACFLDWLIDRRQDTPQVVRGAMLFANAFLWAFVFVTFFARPLFRRMSDSRLALWVEDKSPWLGQRLISAVQLNRRGAATQGMSPELIAVVTREAETQAAAMNFARIADHRRLKWTAYLAAPLALGVVTVFVSCPATIKALLARQFLADREIPRSIYLASISGELVWPIGEEVVLHFRAHGDSLTKNLQGEVRVDPEGQRSERYPLVEESIEDRGQATFVARVPSALADFTYLAWLGDGRTRQPSRIHFEARPIIVEQRAWVVLPRYYGLRPGGEPYEQEQRRGEIVAVPNAAARIAIKIQKPVIRATLELFGAPNVAPDATAAPANASEIVLRRVDLALQDGGRHAEGTIDLNPQETAYRLLVEDQYGFKNPDPPRRTIRILPEELPQVTLLPERFSASGDEGPAEDFEVDGVPVPLGGSIRVAYACSARSGLSRAQLRFHVNEGPWRPLPLSERNASAETGVFDPRQGAFEKSNASDQVEFHAVPSADPEQHPGRMEGGGRFDFQTRSISELKVGDKIEFTVEVFDQNPDPDRSPGRSEARIKSVVTTAELELWVRQTLQEESRIRKLEGDQRGVFARAETSDGSETGSSSSQNPQLANATLRALPVRPPMQRESAFVRDWQLLGPFANPGDRGHDMPYPPESDPALLGKEYDGLKGKIRWRLHQSGTDKIDLEKFFAHGEAGVAYALCWVRSPDKRRAVLATGSDDGIKVWLNRKLVLARRVHREAVPGEDQRRLELSPGWNELMVKVDNDFGSWAFFLELRDPKTNKPLQGVEFRTTPPGDDVHRFARDWYVLGPFPNLNERGHDTSYPPESEKTDLGKAYSGIPGRIKWKAHRSPTDKIDLAKLLARPFREANVAYAVCWVKNDRPRPVLMAAGSHDGIKVWINRRLVLDRRVNREAAPGDDLEQIDLAAGWNELLVKVDNGFGNWAFFLELREPNNSRPLEKVEWRVDPPNPMPPQPARPNSGKKSS